MRVAQAWTVARIPIHFQTAAGVAPHCTEMRKFWKSHWLVGTGRLRATWQLARMPQTVALVVGIFLLTASTCCGLART